MIDYEPNFVAISLSMYKIQEFFRTLPSILLLNLVLTMFMAKNAHSIVVVETRRAITSTSTS